MISFADLRDAIEASWGADTSFMASEWTPENPAHGHCVATSLVVQHFYGGELKKFDAVFQGKHESHYCNILPDGSEVDWTRQQYPVGLPLTPSEVNLHGYATVRDKMMHEPETKRKYELLLVRVEARLADLQG